MCNWNNIFLLALVKAYIIDLWEERKYMAMLNVPVLTLQLGILLGLIYMGRIYSKVCVREVSLAQVSCILMYAYVSPVGVWLMALLLLNCSIHEQIL